MKNNKVMKAYTIFAVLDENNHIQNAKIIQVPPEYIFEEENKNERLIVFSMLHNTFERYKQSYLKEYELYKLPKNKFVRIDLPEADLSLDTKEFSPVEYVENTILPDRTIKKTIISFREAYLEKQHKFISNDNTLDYTKFTLHNLEKCINIPDLTEKQLIDLMLDRSEDKIWESKEKILALLPKTQLYKENNIDENIPIDNMERIHILDLVIAYLKDPESERFKTLNHIYASIVPLSEKVQLPVTHKYFIKQAEFYIDRLSKSSPDDLYPPTFHELNPLQHRNHMLSHYPDEPIVHILNAYCQLFILNQDYKERNYSNKEIYEQKRDEIIKSIVEKQIERFDNINKGTKTSLWQERFEYLLKYIDYLSDEKHSVFKKKAAHLLSSLESKLIPVKETYFEWQVLDRESLLSCSKQLINDHAVFQKAINWQGIAVPYFEFLQNIETAIEHQNEKPVIHIKFNVPETVCVTNQYTCCQFIGNFLRNLTSDRTYFYTLKKDGHFHAFILNKWENAELLYLKTQRIVPKLRRDYLLPLLPIHPVRNAIKNNIDDYMRTEKSLKSKDNCKKNKHK